MGFLLRIAISAAALAVAAWLLDGIRFTGGDDRALTLLGVALIFGLINAFVAPVVKLLSLPFIVLTLGLLLWVINAVMLLLTSAIADELGLGFTVEGFLTALLGALIISVVSAILGAILDD
jgi:putative membrane protein